jgi:hypothetical protein
MQHLKPIHINGFRDFAFSVISTNHVVQFAVQILSFRPPIPEILLIMKALLLTLFSIKKA